MSTLLIIEEDAGRAFLIKKALKGEGHQASVVTECANLAPIRSLQNVDLILVNHFLQKGSGWDVYNRLRKEDGAVPVMLYALPSVNLISVKGLIKAVNEGLKCSKDYELQSGLRLAKQCMTKPLGNTLHIESYRSDLR
jgi:CheY-like chemotaxis protein